LPYNLSAFKITAILPQPFMHPNEDMNFRMPSEPSPPPIQEPPSPENPGAPVREPDPEEPEEI
jgi:hypothetical protein